MDMKLSRTESTAYNTFVDANVPDENQVIQAKEDEEQLAGTTTSPKAFKSVNTTRNTYLDEIVEFATFGEGAAFNRLPGNLRTYTPSPRRHNIEVANIHDSQAITSLQEVENL